MNDNQNPYLDEIERLKKELIEVKSKEQHFHKLYDSLDDLIFIHDLKGNILDVNQSVVDKLGYEKEEVLKMSIAELSSDVKPFTQDDAIQHVKEAIDGGISRFEWQTKSRYSEIFWTEVSLKRITLGGEDRVIAIARDIDDKKRAEQELFETKNLLEASIAQSSSGIIIADAPNVTIRVANNAAFGIRGEKPELLTDIDVDKHGERWQTYKEDGSPYPPQELPLSRAVLKGEVTTGEDLILKDNEGSEHWINANAAPIYNNKGEITAGIVIFLDVTEKKEIELELRKHKENLEKLVQEKTEDLKAANEELIATNEDLFEKSAIIEKQNQELKATLDSLKKTQSQLLHADKMASLGVLTAGVAHEINNPLNYIKGAYLALENFFSENEIIQNKDVDVSLVALKQGFDRVTNIINSLNQFSRDSKIYNEDCSVHQILNNCLIMLRNQYVGLIDIDKKFWPEEIIIKGNVGNLHQVFLNILTNSIQAIKNKGVIHIETSLSNKKCAISINDNGCGISEENLESITDPFFTTKPPGEGTGLGLSITYNIIKEHKGSIYFDSKENVGTNVTVELPT